MKFDAVLFDCDGVLVDSEEITNGVLRAMLGELGWPLTREECMRTSRPSHWSPGSKESCSGRREGCQVACR